MMSFPPSWNEKEENQNHIPITSKPKNILIEIWKNSLKTQNPLFQILTRPLLKIWS
jgi:hypothetical protein